MRESFFVLFLLFSMLLQANEETDRQQIEQRIKPIGQVRIRGKNDISLSGVSSTQQGHGRQIYDLHCAVCHRDGVAGAPRFRDRMDWQPRFAKRNLDSLLLSAMKGLNAMPAKGLCQECTKSDIKAAIEYMVPSHE